MLHKEEEAEPVAMAVGDDEEGAIGGLSGSDILEENDKKLKVSEFKVLYFPSLLTPSSPPPLALFLLPVNP